MPALAPYALPGIIVTSALGAVIMCLLVFRYGFAASEDDDPDETAHRLFVTRFWHALAGVCFAVAAMLAAVAWSARSSTPGPLASPAETTGEGSAERVGRADEEVRRLEERLNNELAALEERLGAVEAAATERRLAAERREGEGATAAPPPPPAPTAARRPAPSGPPVRARPGPADDNGPATLPEDAGPPQLRATVHGVHVDVRSRRGQDRETVYTVSLSDVAGRALTGAEVTLVGRAADGTVFRAALQPTAVAGVYRGWAAREDNALTNLRLRVVRRDKRFELPLAQGVSW